MCMYIYIYTCIGINQRGKKKCGEFYLLPSAAAALNDLLNSFHRLVDRLFSATDSHRALLSTVDFPAMFDQRRSVMKWFITSH